MWLDLHAFSLPGSDIQASEKLEMAAEGWKAAEVGETQLPEEAGRVGSEGSPSIRK